MRDRRHHNNKGTRQIRRGKTRQQVKAIAKQLNIPYKEINTMEDPVYVDEPFEEEIAFQRPGWMTAASNSEQMLLRAVERQFYKSRAEKSMVKAVTDKPDQFPVDWLRECCRIAERMRSRNKMIQLKGLITLIRNEERHREFLDRQTEARSKKSSHGLAMYTNEEEE